MSRTERWRVQQTSAAVKAPAQRAPEYFAIILIGVGSAWGRSPDKETAIKRAITSLKDWQVYYKLSAVEVLINVIDIGGYLDVDVATGRPDWIMGTNEATGEYEAIKSPVEQVKRTTPKWRGKR